MFSIRVEGLDAISRKVSNLPKQVRFAASRALNETMLQDVRPALVNRMDTDFDRPTPWIKKSVWVDQAKPEHLVASVYPQYLGGKSVDPAKVLHAEVLGGPRRMKRAERAFQRVGILSPGWVMIPGKAAPLDAYGNVSAAFIVQLLAYFNAFGEQGYSANMTAKRRAKLSGRGRWVNGRFVAEGARGYTASAPLAFRKGGVQYFVSHGKGLRGALPSEGHHGREQNLRAGIWSRSGIYGEDIKPIFIFVSAASYPVRYRMSDIVNKQAQSNLPRRFAASLSQALSTAK